MSRRDRFEDFLDFVGDSLLGLAVILATLTVIGLFVTSLVMLVLS